RTFHDFNLFDEGIRNTGKAVHRAQTAYNGHPIDEDERIGTFKSVDMDVPRVAHIAIDLWANAIDILERIKNTGCWVLFEKGRRIDLDWNGTFQTADRF